MKRIIKMFAATILGAALLTACGDGYKTTKSGLTYKFFETNKNAQQVQLGDVLVGTCTVRLGDSVLATVDTPDRILMVGESVFQGDLPEGLLMMHLGDKATFGVDADSLNDRGVRLPDFYKKGTGMKFYYDIHLTDIITKEEMEQEQANYYENMQKALEAEKESIAKYVEENNIKVKPDAEGLYVIVKKKGKGPKVEIGREIAVNYTGRLLDGKVFDTSVESIARENNLNDGGRSYGPLRYKVGEMSLIRGWEKGIISQPEGTELTLVIPSSLGYGPQDLGVIPANSPLVFDIDIVSVK